MTVQDPRVSVVIPTWNGLQHLPECLAALAQQTFKAFRVIVVDNASTDGTREWLAEHAPHVHTVAMSRNGGFAYAVNEGIRHSDTEYVALLNNDTAVDTRWLSALVVALDERPGYSFAASRMLVYADPNLTNAAGDVYRLALLEARHRGFFESAKDFSKECRVFGACAGSALYRRSLFDDVGLFDEAYFLMSEDTDLNVRALLAGHRCLYVPGATLRHKIMGTIRTQDRGKMTALARRNQIAVVAKNFPAPVAALAASFWVWRLFRQTFPVRPSYVRQIPRNLPQLPDWVRADLDGLRLGIRLRKVAEPRQRISNFEVLRWLVHGVGAVD